MNLISNSNFRNSQNYILWKKEKYIISNNKKNLNSIFFISSFLISPLILLFFWAILLFIKEFYHLNTYWLDAYWAIWWLLWFLIWGFLSTKIYKFFINRKKYLLLKKNIRILDKEKYYENFIFVNLNNKNKFNIINISKFLTNFFYLIILAVVWYLFFYILVLLPISVILSLFIDKSKLEFLNNPLFNFMIFLIFSVLTYFIFFRDNNTQWKTKSQH